MLVDIVTGATQGIGRSVAEFIAFQRVATPKPIDNNDYLLVLTGRNPSRGQAAASAISKSTRLNAIFEPCDVSDYRDVVRLKDRIEERIISSIYQQKTNPGGETDLQMGILVNGAGECPRQQEFVSRSQRQTSGEVVKVEIDKQFATNVLGYHFTTRVFFGDDAIVDASMQSSASSSSSRIVNIASNWAGNLDLEDLHFHRRGYDNDMAYRQSKQCNRMLTVEWSERLKSAGILVNSCHPGDPCTTLSKALGYNLWSSPPSRSMIERESPIPFLCGLGRDGNSQVTGQWFEGTSQQPRRCQFSGMKREGKRLFDICESFAVDATED